jgi:hypothetical protein
MAKLYEHALKLEQDHSAGLQRAGLLPQEVEALVISVADVWAFPSTRDDPSGSRAKKVIGFNKARRHGHIAR